MSSRAATTTVPAASSRSILLSRVRSAPRTRHPSPGPERDPRVGSTPTDPLSRLETATLSPAATVLRLVHAAITDSFLCAIGYVWWCGLTGRRGPLLTGAIAALTVEAIAVAGNGGDCPLGALQKRLGDEVPLFELVLSPRAAERAVPALGACSALGIALTLRPRQSELSARRSWDMARPRRITRTHS